MSVQGRLRSDKSEENLIENNLYLVIRSAALSGFLWSRHWVFLCATQTSCIQEQPTPILPEIIPPQLLVSRAHITANLRSVSAGTNRRTPLRAINNLSCYHRSRDVAKKDVASPRLAEVSGLLFSVSSGTHRRPWLAGCVMADARRLVRGDVWAGIDNHF